jgi:hypothetical protein
MRLFVLTAALAAVAAPVPAFAADDPDAPRPDSPRVAERLNDPLVQDTLASSIAIMGRVLMDMNVAPMMEAMAKATGEDPRYVDPDTTVGDLAGPDARYMPEEMAQRVPQVMGAMAGMAEGMEDMVPALRDMAEQVRRSIPSRGY